MKIVAANHADSLRRPGASDADAITVLETVRGELREVFGEADDDLPVEMTALARKLDGLARCQERPA